jgi:hypothetical protein
MDGQTTDTENPFLLTLEAWRAARGIALADYYQLLVMLRVDQPCPAVCVHDCECPATGYCAHGCPSLLKALELV